MISLAEDLEITPCRKRAKTQLILNGSGIRTKRIGFQPFVKTIDVYKANLYLKKITHNAEEIMKSSDFKELELEILKLPFGRKLAASDMQDGLDVGWKGNAHLFLGEDLRVKMEKHHARLQEIIRGMGELSEGDRFLFCFFPDRIEFFTKKGREPYVALKPASGSNQIPDSLFSRFLLSFWIGNPPERNEKLKAGLLGIAP